MDGERWIVGKLLTWEKKFPLNDLLTQQKPDVDEDGMLVYCAGKNPRIRTDMLTRTSPSASFGPSGFLVSSG